MRVVNPMIIEKIVGLDLLAQISQHVPTACFSSLKEIPAFSGIPFTLFPT
jgi:hypothetical protein